MSQLKHLVHGTFGHFGGQVDARGYSVRIISDGLSQDIGEAIKDIVKSGNSDAIFKQIKDTSPEIIARYEKYFIYARLYPSDFSDGRPVRGLFHAFLFTIEEMEAINYEPWKYGKYFIKSFGADKIISCDDNIWLTEAESKIGVKLINFPNLQIPTTAASMELKYNYEENLTVINNFQNCAQFSGIPIEVRRYIFTGGAFLFAESEMLQYINPHVFKFAFPRGNFSVSTLFKSIALDELKPELKKKRIPDINQPYSNDNTEKESPFVEIKILDETKDETIAFLKKELQKQKQRIAELEEDIAKKDKELQGFAGNKQDLETKLKETKLSDWHKGKKINEAESKAGALAEEKETLSQGKKRVIKIASVAILIAVVVIFIVWELKDKAKDKAVAKTIKDRNISMDSLKNQQSKDSAERNQAYAKQIGEIEKESEDASEQAKKFKSALEERNKDINDLQISYNLLSLEKESLNKRLNEDKTTSDEKYNKLDADFTKLKREMDSIKPIYDNLLQQEKNKDKDSIKVTVLNDSIKVLNDSIKVLNDSITKLLKVTKPTGKRDKHEDKSE